MGYIGGYIGLFLGYSIIQIPDFLTVIVRRYRSYFVQKEVDVDWEDCSDDSKWCELSFLFVFCKTLFKYFIYLYFSIDTEINWQ